ncbi:hypothetical protein PInf_007016 [Phytophthora infestans]|nr:hypothetical protein PInf_007016 [Phytophthora infestans]
MAAQHPAVPTGPTKRGRKENVSTELWSTDATTALFTARYVTAKDSFKNAINSADIGAAWIRVAALWLWKKWAHYRQDRSATGIVPNVSDSPCLDLMMEHWAPHEGLQNTTLCDNITPEYGEEDEQVEEDTDDQGCRSSKRRKTNDEYVKAALHRQEAVLRLQTSAISALIETLTRGTS